MTAPYPWVLGIDLGTTNTAAVAFGPEHPGPVSILHGRRSAVLPSIVSYRNPRLPIVGWPAKDMLLTDPLTTIYGWKRFIGRHRSSEYVERFRSKFPFRIDAAADGAIGAVVGDDIRSFVEIASLILDQVKSQAHAALQHEIKDAVISVPAHFGHMQRAAILSAAEKAELNVIGLVNEPTAAALAFGTDRNMDSRVLVLDLGGGTFDATILEVVDNVFQVRATRGDGFLGGLDFDLAIMDALADHAASRHKINIREEPVVAQRILNAAEHAKIELSASTSHRIHVPLIGVNHKGKTVDLEYTLTRDALEALVAPKIERALGIVETMLAESNLRPQDLDHIILVGGPTKMPRVRQRIEEAFGRKPLCHLDPDTCVAHGSAIVARSRDDLAGAVLMDVLSVPIGAVLPGGATQFLFEANRSLPARSVLPVTAPQGADAVVVGLWQGSDLTASDREILGLLRIPADLFEPGQDAELALMLDQDLQLRAELSAESKNTALTIEPPAPAPARAD